MSTAPVFLIGARGSGKTTVGRHLAKMFSRMLVDTDTLVTQEAQMRVAEIVEREGWPGFRLREALALGRAIADNAIICTGGGIILDEANVALMRAHGKVVYLSAPLAVLQQRLLRPDAVADRPSLTGQDPVAELAAVLATREPLYRAAAHYIVNAALPPQKIAQDIAVLLA